VTTINAQLGLLTGVATLTVGTAQLQSITVAPPTASIAAGTTQQFTAFGVYSDGTTPIITPLVSWSSSTPAVATVGATGLALGLVSGPTTISATMGSVTGAATLTVTPATLVSISVTPLVTTVPLGGTTQYTATGTFTDLSTQDITSTVAWTTSQSSIAVVNNAGLARSSGVGLTTITATSGTISGTATMTVTSAVLQLLTVTPGSSTCPAGTTEQMTAEGSYTGGVNLNVTSLVTWSTSSPATATVSASGLVTCITGGNATITATLTLVSGTATVTVTQVTLQSITVTAATPSATLGLLDQMTATGHYSDGSTANITSSVIWSVNPALLAGVSPSGGLLAVGVGNVTVTAVLGTVAGHTTIQLLL
jgi:trimeric autotransporter adhesin